MFFSFMEMGLIPMISQSLTTDRVIWKDLIDGKSKQEL